MLINFNIDLAIDGHQIFDKDGNEMELCFSEKAKDHIAKHGSKNFTDEFTGFLYHDKRDSGKIFSWCDVNGCQPYNKQVLFMKISEKPHDNG